jgi:hypothetical protein
MAVWISFAKPADDYDCKNFEHCCVITDDLGNGLTSPQCNLGPPKWQCIGADGNVWRKGQNLSSINFLGPLANSPMKSTAGSGLLLHLANTADLSVPLTNTYAEHQVDGSAACQQLCTEIEDDPSRLSLFGLPSAAKCSLAPGTAPAFKARNYGGRITVNGFGRISGEKMMRNFQFHNASVWDDPAAHALNAYGQLVPKFKSIADAEAHTRWRVMSGLLELSTAIPTHTRAYDQPSNRSRTSFALDVSEITVGHGPKRGDGSIRLQFPRVPLGGAHAVADSDQPASLFDVKTPGAWVGAADGPRVTSSGSSFAFLYLHHADDNLKVDSSHSSIRQITMLQGNIGSAIELGTFGIGLRGNEVRNATVTGVFIHRITHSTGQEDGVGAVLGSRTCPWGIRLLNISITDLSIGAGGGSNQVAALFKIGTYGAPSARFAKHSKLDRWEHCYTVLILYSYCTHTVLILYSYYTHRWVFCSNAWWRDSERIIRGAGQQAATLQGLHFANWTVRVKPTNESWLYNFHPDAETTMEDISFFDEGIVGGRYSSGHRYSHDHDPLLGAIRIYPGDEQSRGDADYFYTPCLGALVGDRQGEGCWDEHGEIGSRRVSVCHHGDGSHSCNTGLAIGTTNSTTFAGIRFLHGKTP